MMKLLTNIFFIYLIFITSAAYSQKPMRAGTTAANFLEIGFGGAGNALGDALVSNVNDVSAIYWNPAGLAAIEFNEVMFTTQPWIAGINTSFSAVCINVENIGTLGFGFILTDYGKMEVTTLDMQEGTGETFSSSDKAFSITYARKLADWFSFGASAKYISSNIWHMNANAIAFDMGVIINTSFFSPTEKAEDGINIGMSISNYGPALKYDGMDLLNPIDISPNESGNYQYVQGQFKTQEWELPLIFRIGASFKPVVIDNHAITVSLNALHPNNNSESVNVGLQYAFTLPSFGKFFLRGGYKGLFMEDSQYGFSFGIGAQADFMFNTGLKFEYAYRDVGILGGSHSYGISIMF
ncbi:MAG: PorV/PorQ family protein [Ignavibacteriaceae bacterium]|nr:PorV/PorQ family protein [Ignavibacteriaceae bacterium]